MNVNEIIETRLKQVVKEELQRHGYDGLCRSEVDGYGGLYPPDEEKYGEGCACELDNLMPCLRGGNDIEDIFCCEGGYHCPDVPGIWEFATGPEVE